MTPEFSRPIDLRQIGTAPVALTATPAERTALAERFSLVAIDRLEATVLLFAEGPVVTASGRLIAAWTQPCAVSGDDLAQSSDEPLGFRFVPESGPVTPGTAIDPFACGTGAEAARQAAGILSAEAAGPFAGLAGLKLKD